MTSIESTMSIKELLTIVSDHQEEKIAMTDADRQLAIDLLKSKAADELEYGEEVKVGKVRLVKRVTGAIGLYFT
ncbi:MAG: hypothetical protein K2Z81_07445 [Cyanobacteria bacterium]|nr:hypothetical protein [Cyanobacteriota bacterium]